MHFYLTCTQNRNCLYSTADVVTPKNATGHPQLASALSALRQRFACTTMRVAGSISAPYDFSSNESIYTVHDCCLTRK